MIESSKNMRYPSHLYKIFSTSHGLGHIEKKISKYRKYPIGINMDFFYDAFTVYSSILSGFRNAISQGRII